MSKLITTVLPPQDYLLRRLRYEHETGFLFWRTIEVISWKNASWNTKYAQKQALASLNKYGYLHGSFENRSLYTHRVVWKMLHGTEPLYIDHVNSVKTDNRIENLRSVTARQNQRNMKLQSRNKSGVVGVCFCNTRMLWLASIRDDVGVNRRLGSFQSFDDAVACRKEAELRYGYHHMHGMK